MATVAIIHIGLTGHVARATRFGAVLSRQGHRVHAWAPEAHRDAIEDSGALLHPHEPLPVRSISGGVAGFGAQQAEATERHLEALVQGLIEHEAELVVYDYHAIWGKAAAEFLGLPAIGSYPLFPALAPPRGELAPAARTGSSRRKPLVPIFPPGWEDSVARAAASRGAIARRWGVDIGDRKQPWPDPDDWAVGYTLPELDGRDERPARWRLLGALLEPHPPPADSRAGSGAPLVYVSLGTFFNYVRGVYDAAIDGLDGEHVEVVISTGRGPISPADLGPLPANISAREYVSGRDLLARAAVTITHCGANSVHEALMAGVPMVCLPQAADQLEWAARIARLGAGQIIEPTPDAIRAAVRQLIEDPRARERARELGQRLVAYDGAGEVSRLVAEVLGAPPPD
jgi:MGT family glycosyltransferase